MASALLKGICVAALCLLLVAVAPLPAAAQVDDTAIKQTAQQILTKHQVQPVGFFVVGSHASGNVKPHSDLDILALVPNLPRAWRQTGVLQEQAYQLSVFGLDMIDGVFEVERRNGNNVVMQQIATGRILQDDQTGALQALQQKAQAQMAQGPYPLTDNSQQVMCYRNKSWLQDLHDVRPPAETQALAAALYTGLVDFYLRSHQQWSALGGKVQARMLASYNPQLAADLTTAFAGLVGQGEKKPFLAVAERMMAKATCDLDNYYFVDPPVMLPAAKSVPPSVTR